MSLGPRWILWMINSGLSSYLSIQTLKGSVVAVNLSRQQPILKLLNKVVVKNCDEPAFGIEIVTIPINSPPPRWAKPSNNGYRSAKTSLASCKNNKEHKLRHVWLVSIDNSGLKVHSSERLIVILLLEASCVLHY